MSPSSTSVELEVGSNPTQVSSTPEFLSQLRALGVRVGAEGGNLTLRAPKGAITESLRTELLRRKPEIIAFLAATSQTSHTVEIPRIDRDGELPVSFQQQRLWFMEQLVPDSALYNMPGALRLHGALNREALGRSLQEIVRRHEVLRTNILTVEGSPRLAIRAADEWAMEEMDLRRGAPAEMDSEVNRAVRRESRRPFDLAHDYLVRASLLILGELDHVLLVVMHHIASDGWSLGVLVRELSRLYPAFCAGQPSPLPELPVQYIDYAAWQRKWLASGVIEAQLPYWKEQLRGPLPVLEIPADHPRPAVQSYRGARRKTYLSKELTEGLKALSRTENTTLFIILLAGFQALLYRYGAGEDIVVGTASANRNRAELNDSIGFFVNNLALRTHVSGGLTVRELLVRARDVVLSGFEHQDVPFDHLVEVLQPQRDMNHSPLIQALFVLHNFAIPSLELSGVSFSQMDIDIGMARFDLSVEGVERNGVLEFDFEYNSDLFEEASITRMQHHYAILLEGMIARLDCPVAQLPMLSGSERNQLEAWNATGREYPQTTIHRLIEEQARRTPEATALRFEGRAMSYGQLNRRANQLAVHLRNLGIGPEVLVGLCMERSLEMVVALLGILKAGGAYVPIDPGYPADRRAYMIEDSHAPVLLTQASLAGALAGAAARLIVLDTAWKEIGRLPEEDLEDGAGPEHLAYVIYTSGSTGKPKGAMNAHQAVCNRLLWMQDEYRLTESDGVLQKTPFSFDVSVWEFFWPLMTGARLVIARPDGHRDPGYLARLIGEEGVTTLHFVPSMLRVFLEAQGMKGCGSIRRVICSGEALPYELQQRFFELSVAPLYNLYGPTEAAVDVTQWACEWESRRRVVPIGRPVANTQIRILDKDLNPVPLGLPGEIYIGGVQVGRGYWGRPDLTAERFIRDPFRTGGRLYRTGDLARWLEDGAIEYLGRNDFQVKLRGFRIELGEIEAALSEHAGVGQAVVAAREDSAGETLLVAYVVEQPPMRLDTASLRDFLRSRFPEYMVPSLYVVLPALPMTPSGKVDREALPAPSDRGVNAAAGGAAPRNAVEQEVAEIWKDLLKNDRVGIHDNFFDLGGHSLLVVQLQNRLRQQLGRELALADLFARPTVAAMAELLGTSGAAVTTEALPWKCLVPVQLRGTRTPLFVVVGYLANISNETELILSRVAVHLEMDRPVYGFRPRWLNGSEVAYRSVGEMARECLDELRTLQPKGPYLLAGYCNAGAVALEMAQQLVREGEEVRLLALVDCFRPSALHTLLVNLSLKLDYVSRKGKHMVEVIVDLTTSTNGSRKHLVYQYVRRKFKKPAERSGQDRSHDLFEQHRRTLMRYRPEPYPGPISLFVSENWYHAIAQVKWHFLQRRLGWQGIARGGLSIHKVPGDHQALLTVNSGVLARLIRKCIADALPEFPPKVGPS